MISFRKLTALPYRCSLLFHLGDGVSFLGDTGVVFSRKPTYIARLGLCLVRTALKQIHFRKPTFIGLKSSAGFTTSQFIVYYSRLSK